MPTPRPAVGVLRSVAALRRSRFGAEQLRLRSRLRASASRRVAASSHARSPPSMAARHAPAHEELESAVEQFAFERRTGEGVLRLCGLEWQASSEHGACLTRKCRMLPCAFHKHGEVECRHVNV
eukprot:scaffold183657_cov31-Tisochrysis_lutea.AAC.2